jgi:preprotein translocase subunit SecF
MWLGIQREDLVKGVVKKDGEAPVDPNDPNAGATV